MILSLIIPVYNVEKYVERCLESCECQNIPKEDYEIIVINDGSTDRSLYKVEKISNKYENIKIYSQQNKGLSEARNYGIRMAQGQFVWFIDSDDSIAKNCLLGICTSLQCGVDLLQIQYQHLYEDSNEIKVETFCEINTVMSGKQQLLNGGIPIPAVSTICRRRFLLDNNLEFFRGIYHEDSEFKPRILFLANKIKSYNHIVYNYYHRTSGSITSSFKLKNGLDILTVNNRLIAFAKESKMEMRYKRFFYTKIGTNLNMLLIGYNHLNTIEKKILINKLRENSNQFYKMFYSSKLKYKLEALVFCINIYIGIFFHKLIRNVSRRL